jgi:hypothetical protein
MPIAADVKVRDMFSYDVLDGVMRLSEVGEVYRVQLYVPRVKEEKEEEEGEGEERVRRADEGEKPVRSVNVTVWKDSEEGSADGGREQQLVEDAVRALLARYEAVLRLVKSTGSLSSSSPKRPSPSSPSCSPPTETDCAVVKRQKLS